MRRRVRDSIFFSRELNLSAVAASVPGSVFVGLSIGVSLLPKSAISIDSLREMDRTNSDSHHY